MTYNNNNKGFFEKLTDLSFTTFIAPQIVGILYVLGMIGVVLVALFACLGALFEGNIFAFLVAVVASVIGVLFYAIILRVSLESFIALIRTAESTRILAEEVLNRRS